MSYIINSNKLHEHTPDSYNDISLMDPFAKIYLTLLLASPFLSYIIYTYLNVGSYYVLGIGAVLIFILIGFGSDIKIPYYILPLFLLFFYYFTWDFFNGKFEQSSLVNLVSKSYTLHTIAILLIVENTRFSNKFITISLNIFKVLALITIFVSIIQFVFSASFFVPANTIDAEKGWEYFRNNSIWGYLGPLDVGLSFLPIMAVVVNEDYNRKKYIQCLLWLLIAGLSAFMNNSRWVLLNFTLLFLLPFFVIKKSPFRKIIMSVTSVALIILLLVGFLEFTNGSTQKYIADRMLSKSADSRLLAIDLFTQFFPKNFVFGTGVRFTPDLKAALAERSSQIHVGYLSHLYEYGIVGSLFLFSFWIIVARKFYRTAKFSNQYGVFIGFLCLIAANLTLVEYSMFHVGLIFLFVFNKFYTDKIILSNINHFTIEEYSGIRGSTLILSYRADKQRSN